MNLLDRLALRGHIRGRLTALQNLPTTGESQTNGELKMQMHIVTTLSVEAVEADWLELTEDEVEALLGDLGRELNDAIQRVGSAHRIALFAGSLPDGAEA